MSCLRADDDFRACPVCESEVIDSLPIFGSEHYKVGFSAKGSIELAFANARSAQ
jgi:hypothetical protein